MQNFPAFYSPYASGFSPSTFGGFMLALLPFIAVIAVWTVLIKGYALWHAARNSQKGWFIALLIINTVGILEIVYLIWFRPKSSHNSAPAVHSSPQA